MGHKRLKFSNCDNFVSDLLQVVVFEHHVPSLAFEAQETLLSRYRDSFKTNPFYNKRRSVLFEEKLNKNSC